MADPQVTRRYALGTTAGVLTVGVAGLGGAENAVPAPVYPAPGAPNSPWLLFVPDANTGGTAAILSAVDARGVTRLLAVKQKLTVTIENAQSIYAIVIYFSADGDPVAVLNRLLTGELRDLRDRTALKIEKIRIEGAIPTAPPR